MKLTVCTLIICLFDFSTVCTLIICLCDFNTVCTLIICLCDFNTVCTLIICLFDFSTVCTLTICLFDFSTSWPLPCTPASASTATCTLCCLSSAKTRWDARFGQASLQESGSVGLKCCLLIWYKQPCFQWSRQGERLFFLILQFFWVYALADSSVLVSPYAHSIHCDQCSSERPQVHLSVIRGLICVVCGESTQRSLAVYVCNENLNIPVFFHPRARPVMLPGSVGFACSECWCQLPWQPCHRARGCPRLWLFWVLMSVTMATLLQNVSFACSECWCQLPWQPCCRVRGCPRLRLFWALMSVTMATLLQSEGLPQAL